MKRSIMAAAVLVVAFAVPAWAADSSPAEKGPQVNSGQPEQGAQIKGGKPKQGGQDFKTKKAQILKSFDERIAGLQKDKKCVQAAKTDADLQGCRQQSMAAREGQRRERGPRGNRDWTRTPGGPAPAPGAAPAPPVQSK